MTYFPGTLGPVPFMGKGSFYDPVKGHTGYDYLMPEGTLLTTPIAGNVVKTLVQKEMGNTLYLEDDQNRIHVFAHLSEFKVLKDTLLKTDASIGLSGNTGTATTTPHLHYEIISPTPEPGAEHMTRELAGFKGYNIDPEKFLKSLTSSEASQEPHWSDDAMQWMLQHELIHELKSPEAPVLWGEFAVVTQRLTQKIMEWTSPQNAASYDRTHQGLEAKTNEVEEEIIIELQ